VTGEDLFFWYATSLFFLKPDGESQANIVAFIFQKQVIWWILEGQDYPRLWWELIPEN
jgi:hypothetical protein